MEKAIHLYHNNVVFRAFVTTVLIIAAAYVGTSIGAAWASKFTHL